MRHMGAASQQSLDTALQWEEGGVAPQVVFEICSPANTIAMMTRKFRFYERHGVEEYYLYDPDTGELSGWQRQGGHPGRDRAHGGLD